MAAPAYTEFEWHTTDAGNGASGEKLTEVFAGIVQKLDGVRTICDLGCGNGHIAGRLASLGYEVTGIDASPSGIRIAQHAYPNVKFVEALINRELTAIDKFDLVIKGGELLDPGQKLRGRRDIGFRFGKIAAIEADIAATRANRVLDASGKLVLPGLIDLHSHVYPYGSAIGIPADELIPFQGTTTLVSAGDAGANNFAAFRRYVMAATRSRLYAFVNIANIGLSGFPEPELYHLGFAHADAAGVAKMQFG